MYTFLFFWLSLARWQQRVPSQTNPLWTLCHILIALIPSPVSRTMKMNFRKVKYLVWFRRNVLHTNVTHANPFPTMKKCMQLQILIAILYVYVSINSVFTYTLFYEPVTFGRLICSYFCPKNVAHSFLICSQFAGFSWKYASMKVVWNSEAQVVLKLFLF